MWHSSNMMHPHEGGAEAELAPGTALAFLGVPAEAAVPLAIHLTICSRRNDQMHMHTLSSSSPIVLRYCLPRPRVGELMPTRQSTLNTKHAGTYPLTRATSGVPYSLTH